MWFTGLRREQSPTRKNLKIVEHHELPSGKVLLKVSPLAAWTWGQVWKYTADNKIEYLPLYDLGYRSIGCEPCTAIPAGRRRPALRPMGRRETGMRHSHRFEAGHARALQLMQIAIGFLIALAVGLTGIGGGSFTVPALMLIVGLPAARFGGNSVRVSRACCA